VSTLTYITCHATQACFYEHVGLRILRLTKSEYGTSMPMSVCLYNKPGNSSTHESKIYTLKQLSISVAQKSLNHTDIMWLCYWMTYTPIFCRERRNNRTRRGGIVRRRKSHLKPLTDSVTAKSELCFPSHTTVV
jgi:hypothetical protein